MPYIGKEPARVPVTAADIPDDSITAAKILDGVITAADIASGAVDTAELAADAVEGSKIADNAVGSEHIAAGSVDNAHLASGIDATKLTTGTIPIARIADDAVTNAKMADDAIDSAQIAAGAVDDAHIVGLTSSKLSGNLPALNASSLTNIPAANITGTLPAISGANLTGIAATVAALTDATVSASAPALTTNPSAIGHVWINKTSGELYICTDVTSNANIWKNVGGGDDIQPIPANLVAWYQDANTVDSSGNGYTGTESGSAGVTSSTSTGPWSGTKNVTLFPDLQGYIALPTGTIVGGSNARTITAWVKPNQTVDNSNYLFGFGKCSGSTFNARMNDSKMSFMGCGNDHDGYGDVIYSTGNWVRVWYTYDGSYVKTYYTTNGTINQSWSWSASLNTNTDSGSEARIGSHNSASDLTAGSYMRDFRIYNVALSTTQMAAMWDD
jgi:hypothetical protein